MHSKETINRITYLASQGVSSRDVAKQVLGSESKKSTINSILKKHKDSGGLLEEIESIIQEAGKLKELFKGKKILFIPDAQIKDGVDLTYVSAIGQYIVDKKPDIIVNAGDWFDFPSLSSYDKGKLSFEGRRLQSDIEVGKAAMELLLKPLRDYQKANPGVYNPRLVFTLGNHEERLNRVPSNNSEFEGFIGYHLLDLEKDWEVIEYLQPINIQGINFVHFIANPMTGKPYGGSAASILKNVGCSFCVGHKQTLDVAIQPVLDGSLRLGIVCGASYLYDEDYKRAGFGNSHFRGVVMLHDAKNGYADPSFISTKFLIERMHK